jgi:hypothetical protein
MISWLFGRGPALAIRTAVIVCALAGTSCLLPQSVDPIVESPHPPPHFVLDSIPDYLLTPVLQLYRQGSGDLSSTPPCHCELDLKVPLVEEDDPTVSLEVRWFVDYDPLVSRLAGTVLTEQLPGDFELNGTIRTLNRTFEFDADSLSIFTNGSHRVDVVVAETAAYIDSATKPNRAIKDGYSADVYSFFVNVKVDQDSSRPTCPGTPPSVRVCQ